MHAMSVNYMLHFKPGVSDITNRFQFQALGAFAFAYRRFACRVIKYPIVLPAAHVKSRAVLWVYESIDIGAQVSRIRTRKSGSC